MPVTMRVKDKKWLEQIKVLTDAHGGMYPGMTQDRLPHTVARRLGCCIESYIPHNPIHKERWVITNEGRKALAQ